jgi:glycosyltransferase involved in cell wall biosynthesis
MRIVLAHSHANTFGGGERSVLEVARALGAAHDVRLLLGGFDPRRTYPELASFPHRRVGRVEWPLLRVRADAIVTNSFGSNLLTVRNSRRVVYWVHSLRSVFLSGRTAPDLIARRMVDRLAVHRAARLIANSRYTARKARQVYGRDVDAVVYPGVDLQLYRPGQGDGRYAITVGRISPEKDLDALLEVWRDMPDLPLHVVGTGPPELMHELRQRAPSGVLWRGALAPMQVAEELRGAAIAVFAAREEEFGIAPLEAMACGLPVVGWSGAGLTETVIDGQTGYLAGDGNTFRARVRLLFHDGALRAALGAAARLRAEQFSWERTAGALVAVCAGLAESRIRVPRP